MQIRAYIDTNIFIYAIIKHPEFGIACKDILLDITKDVFEAAGSNFVAIELLGSLSSIDTEIAKKATLNYFKADIQDLIIDTDVIEFASSINEVINIRYY